MGGWVNGCTMEFVLKFWSTVEEEIKRISVD